MASLGHNWWVDISFCLLVLKSVPIAADALGPYISKLSAVKALAMQDYFLKGGFQQPEPLSVKNEILNSLLRKIQDHNDLLCRKFRLRYLYHLTRNYSMGDKKKKKNQL